MKRALVCLSALGMAFTAAGEDTSRNDELVTSVDQATVKFVAESLGHSVRRPLDTGVGLLAVYADDSNGDELVYAMKGKACGNDGSCLGLEIFVIFNGTFTPEIANGFNQRWSAIKATVSNDDLYLTRYLILDKGQTIGNLRTNVLNTLAIAQLIDDESSLAQAPAPPEPKVPDIPLGDDSGTYANDGACDDARFIPAGSVWGFHRQHILKDATDCGALYSSGDITVHLAFGDNSSAFANNGICDDPRFVGEARSEITSEEHSGKDAADCLAAYSVGAIDRG